MSKKQVFTLLAGCLVTIGAVLVIFAFGAPVNSTLLILLLLLCPLSHFLLMSSMGHHGDEEHDRAQIGKPKA